MFYSDQDLVQDNENEVANRHAVQGKMKEFIRNFGTLKGDYPYRFAPLHCFPGLSFG